MRLILLLAACLSEERFDDRFVAAYCERITTCGDSYLLVVPIGAEAEGCGSSPCESTLAGGQQAASACFARHCTFDAAAGRACIGAVEDASCAGFLDGSGLVACRAVWTGCDGGEGECQE